MSSTCYPSNNVNKAPRGIALRLKRICDIVLSKDYKNYVTARECKSKVVQEHFSETSKLSRAEARQIKPKQQANPRILFATTYNHMLPNMRSMTDWETPACLAFW